MRTAIVLLCATLATVASAQTDSTVFDYAPRDSNVVRYEGGFDFREGVYFNFAAFRSNKPSVPLDKLIGAQGQHITDLRSASDKLFYLDSVGTKQRVDLDRSWGFCDHDVVYIHAGSSFSRIGLMGSIAHLVYDATYRTGMYDGYGYGYGSSSYSVEQQSFLDMETGAFLPVTADGIYQVLQRDDILKEEFDAVPKKKRKDEVIFLFMRRYNERHPLYFPRLPAR